MGDLYKALADPTRRTILDELADRDGQTLFEICTRLIMKHGIGASRQAISQHLDVLEDGGPRPDRALGPIQVPLPRYRAAARDRGALAAAAEGARPMKINVTSVLVDDQAKALALLHRCPRLREEDRYPARRTRWLTVVSPEDPDGVELLLEPDAHPAAKPFKEALVADGLPYTSFASTTSSRVRSAQRPGRQFTQPPAPMGPVTTAVFDDTCGNLIQIAAQAA